MSLTLPIASSRLLLALAVFSSFIVPACAQSPFVDFNNWVTTIDRTDWGIDQWRRELSAAAGRWEPSYGMLFESARKHRNPAIAREAVALMGRTRTLSSVPKLMADARDRNSHPWVRGAAQHALEQLITPLHPILTYEQKHAGLRHSEFPDLSLVSQDRADAIVLYIQELILVRDVMACYNTISKDEKLRALSNFNEYIILGQGSFFIEGADASLDLLDRETDPLVRIMAAKTFYNLFYNPVSLEAGVNEYLNRANIVAAIKKGLKDPSAGVRLSFAELFQRFGQIMTVGINASAGVRQERLHALADSYFDLMIEGLSSQDEDVRNLVVTGFAQFKETLPERFQHKPLINALHAAASRESSAERQREIAALIPSLRP